MSGVDCHRCLDRLKIFLDSCAPSVVLFLEFQHFAMNELKCGLAGYTRHSKNSAQDNDNENIGSSHSD